MEPIAIIGIGCRFPGADSPQAFWQLLSNGVDALRKFRLNVGILTNFTIAIQKLQGK